MAPGTDRGEFGGIAIPGGAPYSQQVFPATFPINIGWPGQHFPAGHEPIGGGVDGGGVDGGGVPHLKSSPVHSVASNVVSAEKFGPTHSPTELTLPTPTPVGH